MIWVHRNEWQPPSRLSFDLLVTSSFCPLFLCFLSPAILLLLPPHSTAGRLMQHFQPEGYECTQEIIISEGGSKDNNGLNGETIGIEEWRRDEEKTRKKIRVDHRSHDSWDVGPWQQMVRSGIFKKSSGDTRIPVATKIQKTYRWVYPFPLYQHYQTQIS